MLSEIKKLFIINAIIFRNAYIRDSKIGGFIFFSVISQLVDILTSILFFNIIFANIQEVGGWNFHQVLFLYAFIMSIQILHGAWLKKGINSMSNELIRLGDMDFFLTKPVNPMILISISKPRMYSFIAFAFDIGLMIYAAVTGHFQLAFIKIVWFLVLAVFSFILYYLLSVLTVIPAFWFTRLWSLSNLMNRLAQFARYPAGMFPRVIRIAFFTLFPILVVSYLPVKTLFFKPVFSDIIYLIAVTVLFGFLTNWLWKLGTQKYGSASS
ncbi:MAG: ABC-2 family transporter protein [Patescibacteria group bacterium]